ncbi:MAG: hypothetical protein JW991_02585 [Candidatus Pacebacteria bacterium]|nr:hypothetical protein [Candidatus Paceibacterota bacterium]
MENKKGLLENTSYQLIVDLLGEPVSLVKKGDMVSRDELLIKIKKPVDNEIDLAAELGIKPHRAMRFLNKELGESVVREEIIAQRGSFLSSRKVLSPATGELASLDETGILVVRTFIKKEIRAPIAGRVSLLSAKKLGITFPCLKLKGTWGTGVRIGGNLALIEADSAKESAFQVRGDFSDKVLIIQGQLSRTFWFKAASLGLLGLVCPSAGESVSKKFLLSRNQIHPSLLVIGQEKFDKKIWEDLKKYEGREVLINPAKAELIIPLSAR